MRCSLLFLIEYSKIPAFSKSFQKSPTYLSTVSVSITARGFTKKPIIFEFGFSVKALTQSKALVFRAIVNGESPCLSIGFG